MKVNVHYYTAYYSNKYLWQAITCHEFGHALGLGHNLSIAPSIMRPVTTQYFNVNGIPQFIAPQNADINTINRVY